MKTKALIYLEDGTYLEGKALGADKPTAAELVFNTSITGYQEIMTDPSYLDQFVIFTYPHIGNTGINTQDIESNQIWASGFLMASSITQHSNWRAENISLNEYLKQNNKTAITDIDTRFLTKKIRDEGVCNASIIHFEEELNDSIINEAKQLVDQFEGLDNKELASVASTQEPYNWNLSTWKLSTNEYPVEDQNDNYPTVAVYDYGVKFNILRLLVANKLNVWVVPANYDPKKIMQQNVKGIMLSNGPGDPKACDYAIKNTRWLIDQDIPMMGICLGFQILGLAQDIQTFKMPFGHHGANHPIKDMNSGKIYISTQNHGFSLTDESIPDHIEVTHRSLFDNTIQGIKFKQKDIFGIQGHPEASGGPHDIGYLFEEFAKMIYAKI